MTCRPRRSKLRESAWITDQPPASTGGDLAVQFYAPEQPQQVLDFYNRELPALGWQPEELSAGVVSDPKLDGTRARSNVSTFVKDGLRIIVNAAPNTKSPARGPTRMGITIVPANIHGRVSPQGRVLPRTQPS